MSEQRTPPYDTDAEASLLGSVMLDNEVMLDAREAIDALDFYKEAHRVMWRRMVELYDADQAIDLVTLTERLRVHDELDRVGGVPYLVGVTNDVSTAAFAGSFLGIVREKGILRRVIDAAGGMLRDAYDGRDEARAVLASAEAALLNISTGRKRHDGQMLSEALLEVLDDLEKPRPDVPRVSWGFRALDDLTGGLERGALYVLGARPSAGKSAFALTCAQHNARRRVHVVVFSLEMRNAQLAMRLIAADARVDMQRIRSRDLSDRDYQRLADSAGRLTEYPIVLDDQADVSVHELRRRCRVLDARFGLDLVIVDYLQLLSGGARFEGRVQEVSAMSRGLKLLARELDAPVLVLSQLSREVERRPNKRPILSDLRESGSIEQDADACLFIYRDEMYDPNSEKAGIAEVILAKQRNGPQGTVELAWLSKTASFAELAAPHHHERQEARS